MSLQPGKHLARAIPSTVQFGRASTGTEQIAVTFRIINGQTQQETGEEITWIGALGNEKSLEITAKALRACGCDDPEQLMTDASSIARNVVELDVQSESYGGKERLKVKWVNTPRRFEFKQPLDAGSRAGALSKLKGYVAKEVAATGAGADADDIPDF